MNVSLLFRIGRATYPSEIWVVQVSGGMRGGRSAGCGSSKRLPAHSSASGRLQCCNYCPRRPPYHHQRLSGICAGKHAKTHVSTLVFLLTKAAQGTACKRQSLCQSSKMDPKFYSTVWIIISRVMLCCSALCRRTAAGWTMRVVATREWYRRDPSGASCSGRRRSCARSHSQPAMFFRRSATPDPRTVTKARSPCPR